MIAKENDTPFGGVNVVFAGDFCQLPPVGGTRLYAGASIRQLSQTKSKIRYWADCCGLGLKIVFY